MPARRTFGAARFRGPVQFDGGANSQGRPVPVFREYVAILDQNGVGAPVATVLRNTLGSEVEWTRAGNGVYEASAEGMFPAGKTIGLSNTMGDDAYTVWPSAFQPTDENTMRLVTGGDNSNFIGVEIRVYP